MDKQMHYLKGSVWHPGPLSLLVTVSRHVNTAVFPPTTNDFTSIPVGMNMTDEKQLHLGPHPHLIHQSNQPLPTGLTWVPVDDSFQECFSAIGPHVTPALIMTLLLSCKLLLKIASIHFQ
jgi:hypothetical protein